MADGLSSCLVRLRLEYVWKILRNIRDDKFGRSSEAAEGKFESPIQFSDLLKIKLLLKITNVFSRSFHLFFSSSSLKITTYQCKS
jgi:hypothetical protein